MRWAPDGQALYTITHGAPIGLEAAEDSPAFDLTALLVPEALQFKSSSLRHVRQPSAISAAAWPRCEARSG